MKIQDLIWFGPARLSGVAHALSWTLDASEEQPTSYAGHRSQPLTISDGVPTQLNVALGSDALDTDTISASVTNAGTRLIRRNHLWVQWDDQARIKLALDRDALDQFSFCGPADSRSDCLVV